MGIDGRDLVRTAPEKDLYESAVVRAAAVALVVVPLLMLVVLTYWIGTLTGGIPGGAISVLSTLLTVGVLWLVRRRRRR